MLQRLENQPWKVMKRIVSVFSLLEEEISSLFTIPGRSKPVLFKGITLGARQDNHLMDKNWHSRLSKYIRLSDTWNKRNIASETIPKWSYHWLDKVKVIPKKNTCCDEPSKMTWELFVDLKEHLNLSVCPHVHKIFPIPNFRRHSIGIIVTLL